MREKEEHPEEIDRAIQALMEEPEEGGRAKKGKAGGGLIRRAGRLSGKRRVLVGAAVVVVLIAGSRLLGGSKETAVPVRVTAVARQDIQEKLSLSGPVSGTDSVDVVSNIHAEITALNVKEGDRVEKGQMLAELDRTELEREVEIARNSYEIAAENLRTQNRDAALGYEKALQELARAQAEYDRNSQLFAIGALSQAQLEQLFDAVSDARRETQRYTVENGQGKADPSYELQVQNAACELEKREEDLANTTIRNTIDGTVVRVNSRVGQFADKVEDDKPILSIENLDQLELEIQVSEYSIGKVQVGQKAEISADILGGETVEGEVTKISPTGEEKGGGSSERVIPTTIRVEGTDSRLIAGITARAQLLVAQAQDALVVPAGAVFETQEGSCVAVVENGQLRRIPVTEGVDGEILIQVIPKEEGSLQEGMQVITDPDPQMAEGTRVQAVPGAGV